MYAALVSIYFSISQNVEYRFFLPQPQRSQKLLSGLRYLELDVEWCAF